MADRAERERAHVGGHGQSPDSLDLPAVAATLDATASALTPCPVLKVQAATVRWADRVAAEVVDGQTLVHTDVTPRNFLIHGGGVTVVDWSMPCRGAAWIDTALMVVRLIRAGYTPEQAEAWAGLIRVWPAARPEAVDAFAVGVAALSRDRHQQRPSATHLGPLADAAESWNHYHGGESHAPGHLVPEAPRRQCCGMRTLDRFSGYES